MARDSIPTKPDIAPRTKIAVHALDPEIDPVAACIGKLGEHLQAIAQEIPGEKIEVIPWSEDPATYIANALAPAQVEGAIALDVENQSAEVVVPPDQLAVALGRGPKSPTRFPSHRVENHPQNPPRTLKFHQL